MRAVLLAAGMGKRLGAIGEAKPKILLEFGGKTLLQRHLEALHAAGVTDIVLGLGFEAGQILKELRRIEGPLNRASGKAGTLETVINPDFDEGSVVTLWMLREAIAYGGDVLLMDADVLYDRRLIDSLLQSPHRNSFLMDRDIEPGEEPVKLCVRDGVLVDFHKRVQAPHDFHGESVGFFRFAPDIARRIVARSEEYVAGGRRGEWYEETIRDVLLASSPATFGYVDVTGLPWIEIDFDKDVVRAEREILPELLAPDPADRSGGGA